MMNKVVTEIAIRAQVEHCVSHVRLEEFAKLIVLECTNEIAKWKCEPFPLDPEVGVQLIKQHFGIEE